MTPAKSSSLFTRFSKWTSRATGNPVTFAMALAVIVIWAVTGPIFRWSDTWQLVINTGTTIVTFLMIFLVQNTQNRDSKAIHLKLDELIHSLKHADNHMINIENLTEEQLCGVCSDPRRDRTVICVVEQPVDVLSLERTHEYRGLYHVLGGALSPLDGVEPGDLRIERLLDRVGADGVEEVVLATNPTMTGEATAAYLADRLRDRVAVTRLASGLPVGGDLEYADEVTLGRALAGRRPA